MLGLTLTPAEVWRPPVNDVVYNGFDPNLIYTSRGGGGAVAVTPGSIDLITGPKSTPSVILATTLMPKLSASVDVVVLDNTGGGQPLRIGVWSPWTGAGHFVVFGSAPENLISAETIGTGGTGPTLVGGAAFGSTILGRYRLGTPYNVAILIDKSIGRITTSVAGNDGVKGEASVDSQHFPLIFRNVQLSLTASTSAGAGTSHTVLRNYSLTLPHQRWWALKVDDPKAEAVLVGLALAGVLLAAIAIARRFRGFVLARGTKPPKPTPLPHPAPERTRGELQPAPPQISGRGRVLMMIIGAIGLYLIGNAFLLPLGGHPFDMGGQKVYAYVARAYGPAQLYYLPNVVSVAKIWNGVPYIEAAFPYGPVTAYLSTAVGWLSSLLLAGGGSFSLNSIQLEYVIKAMNVLFGLGDAALIYLILRQLRVSERWSLISGGLFLFNPAVWFSMSVWGQTHVFSLFFVLAAVLLAEKHMPVWAWIALTAGCLTRPQMVVFALLLGIVFLRKFSWQENLSALSWTVVVTFLALVPLTLATSPSLPVDIMLNNFRVQEAGGNLPSLTTVSQGAYSIWPLVTYFQHGTSGLQRVFTPSSGLLVGGLTYQRLSQVLTVTALLILAGALLVKRRAIERTGAYLPFVALGIASFVMLLTGIVSTHFLLALPFLLLCRRWMGNVAYFYVAAIWTVTTLVPMYGDMGIVMTSQDYPLLARANNHVTQFFVDLYASDRFITVAVVANICAVIWLAWLTYRPALSARKAC